LHAHPPGSCIAKSKSSGMGQFMPPASGTCGYKCIFCINATAPARGPCQLPFRRS
jgi:hypothetical protein